MNLLIVEDEPKIATLLVAYFTRENFSCTVLHEGTHAVEWIQTQNPAFVVLDLMLPGKDGLTICREVRQFSQVPILMLTAKVEEVEMLLGLELGADDYVCKPFSPREVVTRVRTILRRVQTPSPAPSPGLKKYRGICVFEDRFVCQVNGVEVNLTPVEFRLLVAMIDAPGRVFSRQKLMELAYEDYRIVSDRTIDSHLRNLRKKLSAHLEEDLFRSIYGVGYKLT